MILQSSKHFVPLIGVAALIVASLLMFCAASAAPGDLDVSFDAGSGVDGRVNPMVVQPDGKIVIGGYFSDGSLDTGFNRVTSNGEVRKLAFQADGKVVIAGWFTSLNGITREYIARLNADGSLETSFNPGNGLDDLVTCMALQQDGRLLIGGSFGSVNGFARNYVARLFWGDPAVLVSGPVKDNGDFVARFRGLPAWPTPSNPARACHRQPGRS